MSAVVRWTPEQKRAIVAESLGSELTPTEVARKYAISSGLLAVRGTTASPGEARSVSSPDRRRVLRGSSWQLRRAVTGLQRTCVGDGSCVPATTIVTFGWADRDRILVEWHLGARRCRSGW